jgi:predicted flap endonuclease-1-like 5' DNA nuclease
MMMNWMMNHLNPMAGRKKRGMPWWLGFQLAVGIGMLVWYWTRFQEQKGETPFGKGVKLPPEDMEEPVISSSEDEPVGEPDDLTLIWGIGPRVSVALQGAGVSRFTQLADMDGDQILDVLRGAGVRLANTQSWPEQARLAAAGDWEGLKELHAELRAARRAN